MRNLVKYIVAVFILLLPLALGTPSASAATAVVTNANDSGAGSLRAAVANGSYDMITFDSSLLDQTITLTSGELTVSHSVTIDGGSNNITISGNNACRVFHLPAGGVVKFTLKNLTVSGGSINALGGAIWNESGSNTVTVTDCSFTGNTAFNGGVINGYNLTITHCGFISNQATGSGGAIYARKQYTISDCTFTANTSSGDGGAIYSDASSSAIDSTISNCTFASNSVSADHDGAAVFAFGSQKSLIINNCTFTGNSGPSTVVLNAGSNNDLVLNNCTLYDNDGKSIYNTATTYTITLLNCIVWSTKAGSSSITEVQPGTVLVSYSDIKGGFAGSGNINVAPNLDGLGSWGGLVQTMPLHAGSPCIDIGTSTGAPTADARGYSRKGTPDMGAFEYWGTSDLDISNTSSLTADNNCKYTITVTNNGDASNVTLTDVLPAGTSFVSLNSTPAGWTCTPPAVGGTGTFTGSINSLASATISKFVFTVHLTASTGTAISNTAKVTSYSMDPTSTNNSSSATSSVNVPGIIVVPPSLDITEGAAASSFTVRLGSQPAAEVTVPFSSSDASEITVSPASLTFNSANWSTTQTVTVTPVFDGLLDGNQTATVQIGPVASADLVYNGIDPADLTYTVRDRFSSAPTLTGTAGGAHVSLSWTPVAGTASYSIYQSTTSGVYGSVLDSVASTVYSYDATGLSNGTTYYFKVAAVDALNYSIDSNELSRTPQAQISGVPNLTALAGNTKVTLNWTPVAGTVSYSVYESTTSGSYGSPLATVASSVNSYEASGLDNGTTYYFMVKAQDFYGATSSSSEAAIAPQPQITGAPVLSAIAGDTKVNLNWTPAPGSVSYSIFKGNSSGSYGSSLATVASSVYSYEASGLTNGTTYYFMVKAQDFYGATSSSSEVAIAPQPQITGAPVLSATASDTKVNLNWTPAPGSMSYSIYKSNTPGIYGSPLATVASPVNSYEASGLTNRTTYYFMVKAQDFYSNILSSNEVSAIPYHRVSDGGEVSLPAFSPVNSTTGEANVFPAQGGKISLGNDAVLSIPAGALKGSSTSLVKIGKLEQPPTLPSGFMVNGQAYGFTIDGQDHYQFNKPVTITFTFDPAKVPNGETPCVYYYDAAASQWVKLEGTISGNTITISIDHFTTFAVLAKEAAIVKSTTTASFSDINNSWAKPAIEKLVSMGAIGGYQDGTFRPNARITRAEFVTVLVKALTLKAGANTQSFKDTDSHWAKDNIATAVSLGIVGGYPDNSFKPDAPITREQMAVIAVNASKITLANAEVSFMDNDMISSWANGSVKTAVDSGIMHGYPDNTFRPQGNTTRAEAMSVIISLIK